MPGAQYASRQKRLAEIIPSPATKNLHQPRTPIPQSRIPHHAARPQSRPAGFFRFYEAVYYILLSSGIFDDPFQSRPAGFFRFYGLVAYRIFPPERVYLFRFNPVQRDFFVSTLPDAARVDNRR